MDSHTYIHMHTYMHTHGQLATIHICTLKHVHIFMYVPTPTNMSAVICIYTYICTHICLTLYTTTWKIHSHNTTVWLHHMDANKTPGEKTREELHKNAMYCFEQILEATFPINSCCTATYLPSHKRTRYARHCWSKEKFISDVLLWTPTHGHISIGRPPRIYTSSVRTLGVVWGWWITGTDGERESVCVSGKSVLSERLDDDKDGDDVI